MLEKWGIKGSLGFTLYSIIVVSTKLLETGRKYLKSVCCSVCGWLKSIVCCQGGKGMGASLLWGETESWDCSAWRRGSGRISSVSINTWGESGKRQALHSSCRRRGSGHKMEHSWFVCFQIPGSTYAANSTLAQVDQGVCGVSLLGTFLWVALLGQRLDQKASRGLFKSPPFCDSVIHDSDFLSTQIEFRTTGLQP